jgi:hypothetical protein
MVAARPSNLTCCGVGIREEPAKRQTRRRQISAIAPGYPPMSFERANLGGTARDGTGRRGTPDWRIPTPTTPAARPRTPRSYTTSPLSIRPRFRFTRPFLGSPNMKPNTDMLPNDRWAGRAAGWTWQLWAGRTAPRYDRRRRHRRRRPRRAPVSPRSPPQATTIDPLTPPHPPGDI